MELNQTQARVVYNVTAEQDEWTINASVAVVDGKVVNLDGSAVKKDGQTVAFSGFSSGTKFMRTAQNVSDDTVGVYGVVEALIEAVRIKYEK
jgi:ABC-type taurine transport system substrate-binding protein